MSIEFKNLSFAYGSRRVFESLSFSSSADLVVFRGPSGCGKTTLLKLLCGDLNPQEVEWCSASSSAFLVLQEDALAPWLTGIQNIVRFMDVSDERILAHPYFANFAEILSLPVSKMSFGQRRIVELFRATLAEPDLLCLDEPLNFLDPENREVAGQMLIDAQRRMNFQLLISSHYDEDFSGFDRQEFLFDGSLPVRCLNARVPER